MRRYAFIIVCTVILCLSGSLTLIFNTARTAFRQGTSPLSNNSRVIVTAGTHLQIGFVTPTEVSSPQATPKPSPVTTPKSIQPFPPYLTQELALLQSKGRFFYYGNRAIPEIALTFDDGPNPPYTAQILAILQHYSVHATFFCVGRLV